MLSPAQTLALSGSSQALRSTQTVYAGFTIRETAGSTAVVRLYDNTAASGTLLETISLAANESAGAFYPGGIWAATGIYVSIVSGTIEGSVRIG